MRQGNKRDLHIYIYYATPHTQISATYLHPCKFELNDASPRLLIVCYLLRTACGVPCSVSATRQNQRAGYIAAFQKVTAGHHQLSEVTLRPEAHPECTTLRGKSVPSPVLGILDHNESMVGVNKLNLLTHNWYSGLQCFTQSIDSRIQGTVQALHTSQLLNGMNGALFGATRNDITAACNCTCT